MPSSGLLHIRAALRAILRPAVDAVLREPSAAIIQWLINLQRRDEGLKLAEGAAAARREQISRPSSTQWRNTCRRHWQPGQLPARRQHQDARRRARRGQPSAMICRRSSVAASSPTRRPIAPGYAFSGSRPRLAPRHRRCRLRQHASIKLIGRAGPQAARRREGDTGPADRSARRPSSPGHAMQRQAAGLDPQG